MTDLDLIEIIKGEKEDSSDALVELCERHSGIFIKMVNNLSYTMTPLQKQDIIDERAYHIFVAAKKFDENKKVKFPTYLGLMAKWTCLNKGSKNMQDVNTVNFDSIDFQERSEDLLPDENINKMEGMTFLLDEMDNLNETQRRILEERYFSTDNHKLKPWKKVAQKVGKSVQGCIDIHDSSIRELERKAAKQ